MDYLDLTHSSTVRAALTMNLFYFYYLLGVMNFRYNAAKKKFMSNRMVTAVKLVVHLLVPNVVLTYIGITGKSGILLTVPSVHIIVFYFRIACTLLTMNVNLLLNYLYSSANQTTLLNDCFSAVKNRKVFDRNTRRRNSPHKESSIVLGIFLLHHINYELNQYTYVILYDEKWPELTFYVVFYFIEMVTVMNALYYDCVLVTIRWTVQEDCTLLSKCLAQTVKRNSTSAVDAYWWTTIEHFYNRVLVLHARKRAFCRAFQLQLVTVAFNTFISSFSIFYVNLNSVLIASHNSWLEKYKRVTESLGFFSQLGALLLICYHSACLRGEEKKLIHLLVLAQSYLKRDTRNMKRCDALNYRIILMRDSMRIAPLKLFNLDMSFFFGIVAAIVTYLVVLLQFRAMEPNL